MKKSPAPTTTTSLSATVSTAFTGLAVAAGLCLAAALGATAPIAGPAHVSSTHAALTASADQGSGVVVAGGFEWGSNRSR